MAKKKKVPNSYQADVNDKAKALEQVALEVSACAYLDEKTDTKEFMNQCKDPGDAVRLLRKVVRDVALEFISEKLLNKILADYATTIFRDRV